MGNVIDQTQNIEKSSLSPKLSLLDQSKIQVPSNALVVHKDKSMIAIIDKDSTLHFKPVTIGENNGDSVTLLTGIEEGQLIAVEVGENFLEGQKVRMLSDTTSQKPQSEDKNGIPKKDDSQNQVRAYDKAKKMGNK